MLMSKGLEAWSQLYQTCPSMRHRDNKERCEEVEKELKALEIIEENLKYGYVFIGYDKDHKPLFQFVDTKLYEEIKKNLIY